MSHFSGFHCRSAGSSPQDVVAETIFRSGLRRREPFFRAMAFPRQMASSPRFCGPSLPRTGVPLLTPHQAATTTPARVSRTQGASWQRPVAAVALVTAVVPVDAALAVTGCHHHRRHPCTPSALQRVSSHVVASGALAAVGVSSGGRTQTWANTSCQQYMRIVCCTTLKKLTFATHLRCLYTHLIVGTEWILGSFHKKNLSE